MEMNDAYQQRLELHHEYEYLCKQLENMVKWGHLKCGLVVLGKLEDCKRRIDELMATMAAQYASETIKLDVFDKLRGL